MSDPPQPRSADAGSPRGPDGVDGSLLEAARRLSPEERLRWNDRAAGAIPELRHAFAAARADADDLAGAAGGEWG